MCWSVGALVRVIKTYELLTYAPALLARTSICCVEHLPMTYEADIFAKKKGGEKKKHWMRCTDVGSSSSSVQLSICCVELDGSSVQLFDGSSSSSTASIALGR